MADPKVTDAEFPGNGPFAIPLLAACGSLIPSRSDWALVQFQFEDGVKVHVPISSRAAERLVPLLQFWLQQVEANKAKKH